MMTLSSEAVRQAALRLRAAREDRAPCAPIRDLLPEDSLDAGYAVQEENTGHWLGAGRVLVGRKIGLTSKAVQGQLGVDQPDYGMLFADMAFAESEPVPVSRLLQPRAEAEIAFVLGRDLTKDHLTVVDVIGAVEYALPALEIVDSAVADWNIRIVDTVGDNASSGLFVLGTTPRRLADFDVRLCGMTMERGGEPVSTGVGAACLGNPMTAVTWLARKMVEVGRPLSAGDIVLSGALGPLVSVAVGDVIDTRIDGLGAVRAVME
jgi:2-keto-4-pentenoate hydratase